ncbi:MAG: Permease family protein [Candidatus Magasanikbacteria bacterium GW2011_GWA2_37_8]|uniref:Permease family protein n=1 Tax=Candidatus Magasanikbacteria bacterium GW2011_GWA2_37_8 TaxID=1619036 RepID=A0A0G0HPW3_9BACT|nr:MAG: Permease family protein [Candidatus Magasanikbacteria bacterium GW2011_GWA2_37_8]
MLHFLSEFITTNLFLILPDTRLHEVIAYFIYDVIKILLLLIVMIFAVSILRSFFSKEKIKAILAKRHPFWAHLLAGLFGIITPFCSCSAVPLFLGFVEVGIPLGVTFTFLIASPMINEVALILLWGMFGIKIALLYVFSGLIIAIVTGYIIGHFKSETLLNILSTDNKVCSCENKKVLTWQERTGYAIKYTKNIFNKVWLYVVIGVGVGAWIHGYVPADFLINYAGVGKWYAVPLATLIGIPLYSNAAGVIPLVSVLVEKGVGIGTALALMMSVTALSFPEFMILKKVMKKKLLLIFAGVMFVGITIVGYLFNWLLK